MKSLRRGRAEGPSEKVSPGGWSPGKGTGFNAEKRRQERPRASAWVGEEGRGPWHARRDAGLGRNAREETLRNRVSEGRAAGRKAGAEVCAVGDAAGLESRRGPGSDPRTRGAPTPSSRA